MNKRYQFTVIDMETKAVKWTAPFSNTERMLTETLDYSARNPNWAVRIIEIPPEPKKEYKIGDHVMIVGIANHNDPLEGYTGTIKTIEKNGLDKEPYFRIDLDIPYPEDAMLLYEVGRAESEIERT